MLAGPGGASRWVNEDIDALPYADELPEGWRADVDRLVQEEMRRMKKRPKDYLEEMPPAREIDWSGCPLLEKAFARVAEGKGGLDRPDGARYELAPPPKNKRNDEKAWEVAVKNARAQLEHQTLRVQNLELAAKFAPAAWRAHNAHLETNIARYATRASAPPREERRDAPPDDLRRIRTLGDARGEGNPKRPPRVSPPPVRLGVLPSLTRAHGGPASIPARSRLSATQPPHPLQVRAPPERDAGGDRGHQHEAQLAAELRGERA